MELESRNCGKHQNKIQQVRGPDQVVKTESNVDQIRTMDQIEVMMVNGSVFFSVSDSISVTPI